jgi:hypothetical protein
LKDCSRINLGKALKEEKIMKTETSNTTRKVIGTTLMLIGAGTIIGFVSSKRNRIDIQEKALDFGNYLIGMVKSEKSALGEKAREFVRIAKKSSDEIDGQLSKYEKKTF